MFLGSILEILERCSSSHVTEEGARFARKCMQKTVKILFDNSFSEIFNFKMHLMPFKELEYFKRGFKSINWSLKIIHVKIKKFFWEIFYLDCSWLNYYIFGWKRIMYPFLLTDWTIILMFKRYNRKTYTPINWSF